MSEPHSTIAGAITGAGISSVTLLIGAQVDALVIGALAAIYVSICLQTIDKFHKSAIAVLFSALLAGYGSPVAAEWVMGSVPSVAGNHEALRLLLALVIGALAPSVVPLAIKYLNGKVQGGQP